MNEQKRTRQEKGITLIALIITIVVLLILAVVAIRAVQDGGIIDYAKNARDDYQAAQDEEETMLQNYLNVLKEETKTETEEGETDSSSKITWTKTSEGDLAVGSTVKTSTNEEFYVIGFAGTNNETVKLLAKDNIDTTTLVQSASAGTVAFSAAGGFTAGENLNNNSTVKADTTSAVYKAMKYGETLGVTAGRLMLKSEAEELRSVNSDILYGKNGKSSGKYLNYWLGSANSASDVWFVDGDNGDLFYNNYSLDNICGVRPVVEILRSNIS